MPKPCKVDYAPIIAEYQTGEFSIPDLVKKYKCNRTALYNYIKEHDIQINDKLKDGLNAIKRGVAVLNEVKDETISDKITDTERERKKRALLAGLEHLEKFGDFGVGVAQGIKLGIKRSLEFMNAAQDAQEFTEAARGFKIMTDISGVSAMKSPLVAIQNNIQNNAMKTAQNTQIEIKVGFVSAKTDKDEKSDIIDAQEVK